MQLLVKILKNEEVLLLLFSNSQFQLDFLLEKLFCLSMSKSYTSVLASEFLLVLKNHTLLSWYMNDLNTVFNNHPLDLLILIKESCKDIGLSALKTNSVFHLKLIFRFVVCVFLFGE